MAVLQAAINRRLLHSGARRTVVVWYFANVEFDVEVSVVMTIVIILFTVILWRKSLAFWIALKYKIQTVIERILGINLSFTC